MSNFIEDIIDKDLANGRVKSVTVRFPPEPNGYLHIGHAKAICINLSLKKKYKGTMNLRFDDTNPVAEDEHFVDSITEDVKWLGSVDKILYASDYFDKMYDFAMVLVKKGLAFVDETPAEQIKLERGTLEKPGLESKFRNRSIEENTGLFERMREGKFNEGEAVLRAKIDMKSPNINMRDPIIYRVLHSDHHRAKAKWCIYPMYDFAHPLEDCIEGITHSCCSLEFENHRPLYNWVRDNCFYGEPKPQQIEFARLNIDRTIMSKRYLKRLVDEKLVSGWDDPRLPTLKGLKRRGYTASSISNFCEQIGVAKADSIVRPHQLEACIREELNITSDRAFAVLDPLELVIENRSSDFSENLSFTYEKKGKEITRNITISNKLYIEKEDFSIDPAPNFFRLAVGNFVRLKAGYIIECTGYEVDSSGEVIKVMAKIIEGTKSGNIVNPNPPKAKAVIHFVDARTASKAKIRLYDHLLKENCSEPFPNNLNENSLIEVFGFVEPFLVKAKKSTSFQFLRLGYFVRDSIEKDLVFNRTVSLKDSKGKQ